MPPTERNWQLVLATSCFQGPHRGHFSLSVQPSFAPPLGPRTGVQSTARRPAKFWQPPHLHRSGGPLSPGPDVEIKDGAAMTRLRHLQLGPATGLLRIVKERGDGENVHRVRKVYVVLVLLAAAEAIKILKQSMEDTNATLHSQSGSTV